MAPALTLITSILNGRPFIEDMLASVPAAAGVEHLVIDAGSSDGTLDVLRQRTGLRLTVRPGLPLYEAWNEALAAAQGAYVTFLNADDVLAPGALAAVVRDLKGPSDILCAEADAFEDAGQGERRLRYRYCGEALSGLGIDVLMFGAPLINAKIFRRDLLRSAGGFDLSFAIAADRDLLLRLALSASSMAVQYRPTPFYHYRIHGRSKTLRPGASARAAIAREHGRIARRLLADPALDARTRAKAAAWLAHENAVLAVRSVEAGDFRAAVGAASALIRGGAASVAQLAAARRIRRTYARCLREATRSGSPRPAGDAT